MDLRKTAEMVEKIARRTGAMILSAKNVHADAKAGHANFVTETDVAAQAMIIEGLEPLIDGASFKAEEKDNADDPSGYRWVIDPIDGTTNFMKGYGHFGISIALEKDGEGIIGVVFDPSKDDMYVGIKGCGAYLNGKPMHVSECGVETGVVIFGSAIYYEEFRKLTFELSTDIMMICGDIHRTGSSALDLCALAAGKCDGTFQCCIQHWDYAAAKVMIKEAGGSFEPVAVDDRYKAGPVVFVGGNALTFEPIKKEVAAFLEKQRLETLHIIR